MTDEQIKQNAKNYVDSLRDDRDMGKYDYNDMKKSYIKGAHSRDEEIKKLTEQVEELEDEVAQLVNGEDY
jgi:polyhydroxyalkanoate synthesis regulator phasin